MQDRRPILVAGRSGQLSRSLAEDARARGVPLLAMGRPDLDLADAASIERAVARAAPRAVINAAAYTAVDRAEAEPARAFAVNRDGAARLAGAAARLGVPFIHVSSDYVFDGSKDSPYREDDPPAPLGVYGKSKLAGEDAVRNACPAGLILRTSWVYSRFGHNFLTTMLRLAETGAAAQVVDDQHGAPTAAPDLARAMLNLIERMTQTAAPDRARIYHLAARGETTWHGFAAAIFAGWARRGHRVPTLRPIGTDQYPTAARRPRNSRLDCTRIARDFGLRLPPWQHSLALCLDDLAGAHAEAPR